MVQVASGKINAALDKTDGLYADTTEDALNLVKLTNVSLEIAVREMCYLVASQDLQATFSWRSSTNPDIFWREKTVCKST